MNELFNINDEGLFSRPLRLNRYELLVLVDFYRNKERNQEEEKRLEMLERSLRKLSREEYRQNTIF